jgi:hypothetical protein
MFHVLPLGGMHLLSHPVKKKPSGHLPRGDDRKNISYKQRLVVGRFVLFRLNSYHIVQSRVILVFINRQF